MISLSTANKLITYPERNFINLLFYIKIRSETVASFTQKMILLILLSHHAKNKNILSFLHHQVYKLLFQSLQSM